MFGQANRNDKLNAFQKINCKQTLKLQPNNIKLIDAKINCRTHRTNINLLNVSINGILLSTPKIKRAHDTLYSFFACYKKSRQRQSINVPIFSTVFRICFYAFCWHRK